MRTIDQTILNARLADARVLVEIGELAEAEAEVAQVLDESPGDLSALDLLSKIKHLRGELTEAIAYWKRPSATSATRPRRAC